MRKVIKVFACFVLFLILFILFNFFRETSFSNLKGSVVNMDVLRQLNFLESEIDSGLANKMEQEFPEGYIFTHSIYCLTWIELIEDLPVGNEIYKRGLIEIDKSIDSLENPHAKSLFHKNLLPEYGAFYQGWLTYCLGKRLVCLEPSKRKKEDIMHLYNLCKNILSTMDQAPHCIIPSYYEGSWPADNLVCITAMSLYNKVSLNKQDTIAYKSVLENILDNYSHDCLMDHRCSESDGRTLDGLRGCSNALMLIFMKDVNEEYGKQMYRRFARNFIKKVIHRKGIKEYCDNRIDKNGDIDSGPVICEIGMSSTIVGMKAAALYGDNETYMDIKSNIDAVGLVSTFNNKRRYYFGYYPIGDLFIAWSRASEKNILN